MNLIEQLGGYEIKIPDYECYQYHKESLETYEAIKHLSVFGMTAFRATLVRNALLQYRREHNIFEVGDLIRHKDDDLYMNYYGLFTVDRIVGDKGGFMAKGYIGIMYSCSFRHATDEEIEAGRRL